MSKIAYLDCPTGIAGDMCLGALVDLGVPLAYLTEQIDRLGISEEYELKAETVHRNGQRATKVHVNLNSTDGLQPPSHEHGHDHPESQSVDHEHEPVIHKHGHDHHEQDRVSHQYDRVNHSHAQDHHEYSHIHHKHEEIDHKHDRVPHQHRHDKLRHLPEIEKMITAAKLPSRAGAWSLAVFRQLAEAEGAVHGIPPEHVHFHEVGAIDAIVDIVGTCLGLDWLGIDRIVCSALPTGGGTVWAAHGRLPVPVPAVLKLFELGHVPIYHNGIERELVTPTGAAIATTLAIGFGAPPNMTVQKTGLGAGSIDLQIPNILRIWIGTTEETHSAPRQTATPREITVLETQIDDLNPQAIGYLFDTLLAAGALDVFTQAIGMKKSRPGILVTVICSPETVATCETILFRETSTLGIRRSSQARSVLDRTFHSVKTEYGSIQVKVASHNGSIVNVQPEYEDCARIARSHNLPWREVHRMALQTWHLTHS